MNEIERDVSIEQVDYNVDINTENYSIDILSQPTFELQLNEQGPQGARGYTGVGIAMINLEYQRANIDVYRILMTNGEEYHFSVTNGLPGETGNGIDHIEKTGTSGNVDTYTIYYTDGGEDEFTVTNGINGSDGVGVDSVTLDYTSGLEKYYHMNFTDGLYYEYVVTDGKDGTDGIDGYSPTATVSKVGDTATISITDKNGTTTATVTDGINGITTLSGMTDVDLTNLANGQGLIYNAVTQKWENANITLNNVVDLTSNQVINGRKEFYNLNVTNGNSYGKVATVGGVYNLYDTNTPASSGIIFGDELLGGNTLRENVRQFAYNSSTDEDELATIFNNANLVAGTNVTLTYNSNTGKYSINSSATPITVDQTYNSASSNPQSGTAIAGAGFVNQTDLQNALNGKQDVLTAGTGIDITNNVISNTQTSAEWGNITGDIADQTDLQDALADKQDKLTAGIDLEIVVGSGASNTVSGTGSVTLSNAAANSLSSVIVYGKCSQTGTPTTSNPIDILCNNGAIKYNTSTSTFYADGTVETITDSLGNTATAEMLLGFGDYVDTQDLLGVGGTRKVGLMVLTGTEEFDTNTLSNCYSLTNALGSGNLTDRTVYCTHFRNSSTLPAAANRQGYALIGNKSTPSSSYTVGFGATSQFSTVALFKSWLATQYANGTPVIIAYPLTNPTTFSASAQTLNTKSGSNKLTITQSAISNLSIKATYTTDSTSTINFTNDSGYITGINSTNVTTALGYTPVNPTSLATVATTGSYNDLADKPYIPSGVVVDQTYNPSSANAQSGVAINGAGFLTGITSSDVTTALGYTPYNSSNPNGYTSNVGTVTSVNNVQPVNGNVTITIPTVPTNVSAFNNDAGYITSSALTGYATQSWVGQQGYLTSSSIANMQTTGNLVTSISSSSTDSQYPSAKCMYDIVGDIETLLQVV